MKFIPPLILIVPALILIINLSSAVGSSTVSVNFEVQDESGSPLKDALVIIQGIGSTNIGFSQNKLTDSNGKVAFNLNQNERFRYIVYKLSYKEKTEDFSTIGGNKNIPIITLEKLPNDQWNFSLINNGEIEFQFKSLDDDTNYNLGDYIKGIFEIRNVAGKNIELLLNKSIFQVVDSQTLNPINGWGNLKPSNPAIMMMNATLKRDGWVRGTLSEGMVEVCVGNIIIDYQGQKIDLLGSESVCATDPQDNKIPEWILKNKYRINSIYFYKIDDIEKNINFKSQEFFINNTVGGPNNPPIITSSPILSVNESTSYSYQVVATDADNDALTYSLTTSPTWLSIDSVTGLISGTAPNVTTDTDYTVIVRASDGTDFASQTFNLTVKNIEAIIPPDTTPPVINIISPTNLANYTIHITSINYTATDANLASCRYSLNNGVTNVTVTCNNLITGITSIEGANTWLVYANDTAGNTVSQIVTFNVNIPVPINNPPVITSTPITEINESADYSYQVTATDTDNDALTYSLTTSPTGLSINSVTGAITGTAPEVDEDTNYTVTAQVSDGTNFASQTFNLTVKNIEAIIPPDTTPPVINIISPTNLANYTIHITSINYTATDANLASCRYSLNNGVTNVTVTCNNLITGITSIEGTNTWLVYANDTAGNTVSQTITFNVNIPVIPNNLPVITSSPILSVNESTSYSYQVVATDADNDALTYSLTTSPTWLSIDSVTGAITGTASEVDEDTNYTVTAQVSDGTDSNVQNYVLTVFNVPESNNPSIIISTPITFVNESTDYSYQVVATDADNDALTYSLTQYPDWLSIDAKTGLISGTAPGVSLDTNYNITLKVSDGIVNVTQSYVLTVKMVNNIPIIMSVAVTRVDEKQNYIYQVNASDADGDVLTYSLTQYPDWLSINSSTGLIAGTAPKIYQDTAFNVTVKVSDAIGGSAIQSYILVVKEIPNLESKTKNININFFSKDEFYEQKYSDQFEVSKTVISSIPATNLPAVSPLKSMLEAIDKKVDASTILVLMMLNLNLIAFIILGTIKKLNTNLLMNKVILPKK